jgi:hypothetical protein
MPMATRRSSRNGVSATAADDRISPQNRPKRTVRETAALGELVSLARPSVTVALMWRCGRMLFAGRRGLQPEQAHRRFDTARCFARRSDSVDQRQVASRRSCSMASTSVTPDECGGLTLAMRAVLQ